MTYDNKVATEEQWQYTYENSAEARRVTLVGDTGNSSIINEDGQLHTVMRGKQDTGNSTTTPLLADGVFTGTSIDTLDYAAVSLVVYSDVASTTDGLMVEYSDNGTEWHEGEVYTIEAGATKFFTPTLQARYMRVSYTNGPADQTEFHLHTVLRKSPIKWSSHRIQDDLKDEDDGELTINVLKLRTSQNNYVSGSATNSGNFKVSLEELESGISTNSNSQLKTTIYDEGGIPASVDDSSESLQTIDYAHHEIHSGSTYRTQCFNDSIGNGGTVVIGFYVPDQTKMPHMTWEFVHSGTMTMRLYEDVTITAGTGTDRLCRNSRRDAGDTSILQGTGTGSLVSNYVTCEPTISGGTVISLKKDYSAKNTAGGGARRNEIILKPDTYYAFELTNEETTAQGGQIRLEWYEHSDKN